MSGTSESDANGGENSPASYCWFVKLRGISFEFGRENEDCCAITDCKPQTTSVARTSDLNMLDRGMVGARLNVGFITEL